MITLLSACTFVGFYLWYITTKRIKVEPWLGIETWAKKHHKESKLAGSLFLLVAAGTAFYVYGLGAGAFMFAVAFMTISCLVILLVPLQLISKSFLALMFVLIFLVETFL
ncbi:MAG: hypothetical protein AAGC85_23195 [Bacteroidota bacterium]